MTVLVTGASGFIGGFLVEQLVARGYQIRCLVLEDAPLGYLSRLPVEIAFGDVRRPETLTEAVRGAEYIYHLAGVKSEWEEAIYFQVNYEGTKNLLNTCLRENRKTKRFIYVSSQAAAGPSPDGRPITEEDVCRPLNSYGKSKRAAEEYLKAHSREVPITILRPSLVYGPRSPETRLVLDILKWGFVPAIRHHNQCVNLIHVSDAVDGIILAAEHERASCEIYFITSQECYTWKQIGEQFFRMRNEKGRVIPLPLGAIRLVTGMVRSYRKLTGQPFSLIDEKMSEVLQKHWVCSGEKAKRDLGFEPKIPLRKGAEETVHWYSELKQ